MSKPKVLITGVSGFIGSTLARRLAQEGYSVKATSRRKPAILDRADMRKVEFIPSDLSQPQTLAAAVQGVDRVYHLGAVFDFATPYATLRKVNVDGSAALAEVAAQAGVKEFIHVSSGAVYGIHYGRRRCVESDAPLPTDKYAQSKFESEEAVWSRRGAMRVLILRPGAVYGPGGCYGDATALRLLHMGLLFGVPGFRDVYSSHVHVEDMVEAMVALSENPSAYDAKTADSSRVTYNVCDNTPKSALELLDFVSRRISVGPLGFHSWLRLPLFGLRLAAAFVESGAKMLGVKPLFERDSIDYVGKDHCLDNSKMLACGVTLRFPETFQGLAPTLRWYEETGWEVFKESDPTRLARPSLPPLPSASWGG